MQNGAKKQKGRKMKRCVLEESERLKKGEKECAVEKEEMRKMRRLQMVIEELENEEWNGCVNRNGGGLE